VDDLAVQFVLRFEVRDLERAHGLDGRGEGVVGPARFSRGLQASPRSPQRPEHLRSIEALTLAMLAVGHVVRHLH
jgi:hypothetical protein